MQMRHEDLLKTKSSILDQIMELADDSVLSKLKTREPELEAEDPAITALAVEAAPATELGLETPELGLETAALGEEDAIGEEDLALLLSLHKDEEEVY